MSTNNWFKVNDESKILDIGNSNAKVTVKVFSSLTCPHCANFHENIFENLKNLNEYDGLIWGGSSLNIYNNTIEIRRQIDFMKECQNKIKKMLAICWGMQVAVTAAGGEVKKELTAIYR